MELFVSRRLDQDVIHKYLAINGYPAYFSVLGLVILLAQWR